MVHMIQHTIMKLLTRAFLLTFLSITALYLSTATALAQMPALPADLQGWAWSSTIGWISMSCNNTSTCGTSDYGVNIDTSNNLTGYAWSANVGWIRFGGLSSFPNATGNVSQNARIVNQGSYAELEGWARACGGTASAPGACSNMNNNTLAGGWDGWISLKGTAANGSAYGVRFNNSTVNPTFRFAWGSTVVGWIDFSGVIATEAPSINSFTVTPTELGVGDPATLTWNVQGFDSCSAANNRNQSDWNSSTPVSVSAGNHTSIVNPPLGTAVYTLNCLSGGTTVTETATVTGFTNIVINAFSRSALPAPNADGTYDNVRFLASVGGLPNEQSAGYRLRVSGATTQNLTGTVSRSGGTTTFNPPLRVNDLNFGDHNFRLEIDLPAPGVIPENLSSTPQDEDVAGNTFDLNNQSFPPIPPTMDIFTVDGQYFIRVGERTEIDWTVSTPYVANCTVTGAGINESFSTPANLAAVARGPRNTNQMQSTSMIVLTCTEPTTATVFTDEIRVEVIPNVEEI